MGTRFFFPGVARLNGLTLAFKVSQLLVSKTKSLVTQDRVPGKMLKPGRSKPAPISGRPYMPGYDMMFDKNRKSLPWAWAVERLTNSHNYWLMSTWLNGRPHSMPVWGVWVRNSFFFSTGAKSRKSKNLQANPKCIVCPEGAAEGVVLEGVAVICSDRALLRQCTQAYNKKYRWDLKGTKDPIYRVVPRVAFGLSENLSRVKGNPTRWTFLKR